jgi:hypothetical protein
MGKYTKSYFCKLFCMGETWSFVLREEHRLRVFENRVLRRISGPKRDKVTGEWRSFKRSFIFCTHPQILLRGSNKGE